MNVPYRGLAAKNASYVCWPRLYRAYSSPAPPERKDLLYPNGIRGQPTFALRDVSLDSRVHGRHSRSHRLSLGAAAAARRHETRCVRNAHLSGASTQPRRCARQRTTQPVNYPNRTLRPATIHETQTRPAGHTGVPVRCYSQSTVQSLDRPLRVEPEFGAFR